MFEYGEEYDLYFVDGTNTRIRLAQVLYPNFRDTEQPSTIVSEKGSLINWHNVIRMVKVVQDADVRPL